MFEGSGVRLEGAVLDRGGKQEVIAGAGPVSIEDIVAVAEGRASVTLTDDPAFLDMIRAGEAFVDQLVAGNAVVYGITTGYGDSCTTSVPEDFVAELPLHLLRYHGCGGGRYLTETETRATMFVRLVSLAQQYSAVSLGLLTRLAELSQSQYPAADPG